MNPAKKYVDRNLNKGITKAPAGMILNRFIIFITVHVCAYQANRESYLFFKTLQSLELSHLLVLQQHLHRQIREV